jgi:hypothetical protein
MSKEIVVIWEIADEWRVRTEPMNFVLEKLGTTVSRETREERPEWKFVGYYMNLSACLKALPNELALDPRIEDVTELLDRLQTLASQYTAGSPAASQNAPARSRRVAEAPPNEDAPKRRRRRNKEAAQ